ncbi:MAG: hypothetical protein WC619_02000 [Patescibacteria group bacterium]
MKSILIIKKKYINYQKIKLLGGAEVSVDLDGRHVACQKCGKLLRFGITANGKYMPIIRAGDNYQSHFADCPGANKFRKSDSLNRIEEIEHNQEALNNL